jgi:hypothetical protein
LGPWLEPGGAQWNYATEYTKLNNIFDCLSTGLYTPGFDEVGLGKLNHLTEFLKSRSGKFVVDSHYTDFFG